MKDKIDSLNMIMLTKKELLIKSAFQYIHDVTVAFNIKEQLICANKIDFYDIAKTDLSS